MRCICRHCGMVHRDKRSSHLVKEHGIPRSQRMVVDNYLRPEMVGLSASTIAQYPDGAFLRFPRWVQYPISDADAERLGNGEWHG